MAARLATPARWSRVCILAARLALHKGSAAGSWSGVAKSMCSVILKRGSEEETKIKYKKAKTLQFWVVECCVAMMSMRQQSLPFPFCFPVLFTQQICYGDKKKTHKSLPNWNSVHMVNSSLWKWLVRIQKMTNVTLNTVCVFYIPLLTLQHYQLIMETYIQVMKCCIRIFWPV